MPFIKTFTQLKRIIIKAKKAGKIIVTTNGCFDIIHLGHIKYLEKAKKLGDMLVVGINSDSSVKQIKGLQRPINPENDRAEIVASIRWVDYSFIFKETDPRLFLNELKPDFHVKGGDYNLDKIIEKKTVEKNKGKIVLLSFVKGKSTTKIINKISN